MKTVELYQLVNETGRSSYRTHDPDNPSAGETQRISPWEQQQQDELNRTRQQNIQAEYQRRQERNTQFRQELQDIRAFQDMRNENERDLLSQAREREQQAIARQQASQGGRMNGWGPGNASQQIQRDSQAHDKALLDIRRQQDKDYQQRQQQLQRPPYR